MKIVIIIPAYNEARTISSLVKANIDLGYGVIVVDDGSIDDTAILAKTQGAFVISTHKKSGKGNALKLAFAQAIAQDYDVVITMDGDGQHAVGDIAHFLESYQKSNADIVNGNRMHNTKDMPWLRKLTNAFMSWMISVICRQKIEDSQCGFRLISTRVLRSIKLTRKNFEIETEILIKASKKNFRITSVGIQTIYRDEISKIHPIKDTFRFIRYLIREMFS